MAFYYRYFCIENKGADQLCGSCADDPCLFHISIKSLNSRFSHDHEVQVFTLRSKPVNHLCKYLNTRQGPVVQSIVRC